MNLLSAKLYDPGAAVSKSTASLIAMTALDTTNLRLAITVPAHGFVRFRLMTSISGATTFPSVILGVLNGSTVLGRQVATFFNGTASGATAQGVLIAEFTCTGLTPGALNADAAYAVQVVVAATNLKYGGPNDTTGNDAWGGFCFEAWDPQPLPTAAAGAANGLFIAGTNAATTISGLTLTGANAVGGTPATNGLKITGGTASTSVGGTAAAGLNVTGGSSAASQNGAAGGIFVTAGLLTTVGSAAYGISINGASSGAGMLISGAGTGHGIDVSSGAGATGNGINVVAFSINGSGLKLIKSGSGSDLDATSTKLALAKTTNITGFNDIAATSVVSSGAITTSGGAVTTVTNLTNLPSIPNNWLTAAGINAAALNGKGDWLTSAAYTAPDNASITSIKGKTDSLTFTVATKLDVNVLKINGVTIVGDGSATPFNV